MKVALYEVHLRRADGLDEVRITDVPFQVGQVVSIGSRTWEVSRTVLGVASNAALRYELEELHARAVEARRQAADIVERAVNAYGHSVTLIEDARALQAEARQARKNRREQAVRRASASGQVVSPSVPDAVDAAFKRLGSSTQH